MKSKIKKTLSFLFLVIIATARALTANIYVDSTAAPGGDGSQGHPFQTISEAFDALAVINAIDQGGHTISVTSGIYTEAVLIVSGHSGKTNAPNTLLGNNHPVIVTDPARMEILNVTNFVVSGFDITGPGHGVLIPEGNRSTENLIFDSCRIYGNEGVGIYASRYVNANITNCFIGFNRGHGIQHEHTTTLLIDNCTIIGNDECGYRSADNGPSTLTLRNSVFAFNNEFGLARIIHDHRWHTTANNNVFYGNHAGNWLWNNAKTANTTEEINDLDSLHGVSVFSANKFQNPGYVRMAQEGMGSSLTELTFNPLLVYEHSPLIGAGHDGADIGMQGVDASTPVSSNIYHVSTTGNDAHSKNAAQNPETPWLTIQHAANKMVAGDTVIVAPGEYTENVVITNTTVENYPVRFLGQRGAVLNAGGGHGFELKSAPDIMISGFEIRNFLYGINLTCTLAPASEISNVVLHSGAQGIYMASGWHIVENSEIYNNTRGLEIRSFCRNAIIRNSDIHSNSDGVYQHSPDRARLADNRVNAFSLENCNVYGNTGHGMVLARRRTGAVIYNSNMVNNGGAGFFNDQGLHVWYEFWNCNITGNSGYGVNRNDAAEITMRFCNLHNNAPALFRDSDGTEYNDINVINNLSANYANNINVDPKFRNAAAGYFKLAPDSACIDAGDTQTHLETDYYGNPRLYGTALDIGIYEMQGPGTIFRLW